MSDPEEDAYWAEREVDKWHAQAEGAVDQMLRAQAENERLQIRLQAAEALANAVSDYLPDQCSMLHLTDMCVCDIRAALAAYREASK